MEKRSFLRKLVQVEVHIVLEFMWLKWRYATQVSKRQESCFLEKSHQRRRSKEALQKDQHEMQLSFFNLDDPLLEQLRDEITDLDIDTLTPVEALMKLNEIKRRLGG